MTIEVSPELGVPLLPAESYMDLRARAEAACNTALLLEEHGLDTTPDDIDNDIASTLVASYATNPQKASKKVSNSRMAAMTPAALMQTHAILKEFGHLVATRAAEIRHLVTNKLINETENPDARVRIQALVNLGKMTEVGLFTDRKEITVTHQNADDLREQLRKKLETLKKNAEGVYEIEDIEDIEDIESGGGDGTD